jgi:acetyltransferase-like isoleucine patch superfamily enzyme
MPTPRKVAALFRYVWLRIRSRYFEGRPFFIGPRSTFDLDRNVWFSRGCTLAVHESVSIGSNCVFAEYVSIHDNNHAGGALQEPLAGRGFETPPIRIGGNGDPGRPGRHYGRGRSCT